MVSLRKLALSTLLVESLSAQMGCARPYCIYYAVEWWHDDKNYASMAILKHNVGALQSASHCG